MLLFRNWVFTIPTILLAISCSSDDSSSVRSEDATVGSEDGSSLTTTHFTFVPGIQNWSATATTGVSTSSTMGSASPVSSIVPDASAYAEYDASTIPNTPSPTSTSTTQTTTAPKNSNTPSAQSSGSLLSNFHGTLTNTSPTSTAPLLSTGITTTMSNAQLSTVNSSMFYVVPDDETNTASTPSLAGLFTRNSSLDDGGTDSFTAVVGNTGMVGGQADPKVRDGRMKGDILRYDFCGSDNARLSSDEMITVMAIKQKVVPTLALSNCADHVVNSLQNLQTIDLSSSNLTDVSPLMGMTQLTTLKLNNNQLNDLTYLAALTKLTNLDLSFNQISALNGLESLLTLTNLNLSNNQIQDVSLLVVLINLTFLDISNNQVKSIVPLHSLVHTSVNYDGNAGVKTEVETIKKAAPNCMDADSSGLMGSMAAINCGVNTLGAGVIQMGEAAVGIQPTGNTKKTN